MRKSEKPLKLSDSLSSIALSSVRHIFENDLLPERTRVQNVLEFLRQHDGAVSKIATIERNISVLPPATDVPSVEPSTVLRSSPNVTRRIVRSPQSVTAQR
jgi:hypothetical protein